MSTPELEELRCAIWAARERGAQLQLELPDTLYVDQRSYSLLCHHCGDQQTAGWLTANYDEGAALRVYGMQVFSVIDRAQHIAVLRRQP